MNRRENRSNKYQNIFTEQLYSNDMMSDFAEHQGLAEYVDPELKESLMDLHDELKQEFWRLVRAELTLRQQQVLEMSALERKTQIEIAKMLKVNQSSITKSLNGNCDYRNGKRVYGGCRKRLQKLVEKDEKIQAILARIATLQAE